MNGPSVGRCQVLLTFVKCYIIQKSCSAENPTEAVYDDETSLSIGRVTLKHEGSHDNKIGVLVAENKRLLITL